MIKADTLLCHELIGLNIHILDDTSVTLTDVSGNIINETKNTFLIRTPRGTKMITKKNATKIGFAIDSGVCFISGASLIGRPEDRITRNC
ncbi:MAG TPA: ribonuclease P protein subunit [Nitrososphaeraceae archaeon]|jgi:ribonuclease P protein subunit POP4|nr:ribonuclease P protein subunit [Nitrososphaeraceae archaeon]HJU85050.1 ribonuclease P protein subunit [Nitrososphaeraceae archaeon]